MNVWQITQQILSILGGSTGGVPNLTWPDAPNEAVLSRVCAAPAPAGYFRQDLVAPFGILQLETARANEEHPADLIDEARWTLYLIAGNATEQGGASPVVGGNRASLGSSKGRGLLEIEPLVCQAIFNATGLAARPRGTAFRAPSVPDELAGAVVMRAIEITVGRMPVLPDYAPIRRLKASVVFTSAIVSFLDTTLMAGAVVTASWTDHLSVAHTLAATAGVDFAIAPGDVTQTAINYNAWLNGQTTTDLQHVRSTNLVTLTTINGATNLQVTVTSAHGITVTGNGGAGTATFTWAGITRYDLVGFTWARAQGATPSDPTAGTFVAGAGATGFSDTPPVSGTWTYTFWWAFDATVDPVSGIGVAPVAANRWSSQQSSQAGRVYLPASITVTA